MTEMTKPTRFAVTSQNFRTITGHAGKARRFILFEASGPDRIAEIGRLDLPIEMAMHGFDDRREHPLDGVDLLLTGGAGEGFVMRMARRGIRVVRTGETDPLTAVRACFLGNLKPPLPHDHDDHGHAHDEGHSCGCGH
ncbi:MAG: NifB/NifX family molybdenum-iron cluster-binding protein [Pseudomonadota bacterium]|uniref:NifB/NifX family molybdenum-iron cluster-binding protein n=1 Tax=Sulfuricystis thermophila TaxID=2496847 RepID=UPI0024E03819|nr:NifB/NifX family molybdenum-iron cluster-binding protein [Sulfuricystis thermophila]